MSSTASQFNSIRDPLLRGGALLFAVAASLTFALRAYDAVHFLEFGDETEKMVAAQMLQHGMRLYRDIFAHHGPLQYMVAHAYAATVSGSDFSYLRLSQIFLATCSSVALFFSPALKTTESRAWAIGSYLFLLSSTWALMGMHMLLYQAMGGLLFSIALSQFFLPLFVGAEPSKPGLVGSGLALALACFAAYAYGLACLALIIGGAILCAERGGRLKRTLFPVATGAAIGGLMVLSWLLLFADLKGFVVYHFYFNQAVYSTFIGYSPSSVLGAFSLSLLPDSILYSFALLLLALSVGLLLALMREVERTKLRLARYLALVMLFTAIVLLNPRGNTGGLHTSAFVIASLALFSLALGVVYQFRPSQAGSDSRVGLASMAILAAVAMESGGGLALSSPGNVPRRDFGDHLVHLKPADDGLNGTIRSVSREDDRILALVFKPRLYIQSGRLPASGQFYYLPWQAAYNKNPVENYKFDLCSDIEKLMPRLIYFDNWKIWDRYEMPEYAPCFLPLLSEHYQPADTEGRLYVRRDAPAELSLK